MHVFELEEEQEDSWLVNFVQQVKAENVPEEPGEGMADSIRLDAWQRVVDLYMDRTAKQSGAADSSPLSEDHPSSHRNSPDAENDGFEFANIGPGSGGGPFGGGGPPGGGGGGGGGNNEPLYDTYITGTPAEYGVDNDEFNIQIDFYGTSWTQELQDYFVNAADYLSSVIIADVEFADLNGKWIDDIIIDAYLTDIDGVGGVLGQTGVTSYRAGSINQEEDFLPATALMEFDTADTSLTPQFEATVLHEMVHALGFGLMWDLEGLETIDTNGTRRPNDDTSVFNGTEANRAFQEAKSNGEYADVDKLYIETDGGSGTADFHWDEEAFGDLLMTGYLTGNPVELSDISIASLEDLGYETTWVGLDDMIA